jgi:hypothetical protein
LRAIERRVSRLAAPTIAYRDELRACAAIGAGCRQAVRGLSEVDRTRRAIIRLGAEAAALLVAIPDTPELRAADRAFAAATPREAGRPSCRVARQMRHLVERYRDEAGFARIELELALEAAYAAACAARVAPAGPANPTGRGCPEISQ